MYDVLKDALKTDKRISAVLDIDFDIGAFSVLNPEKNAWEKYSIESIVQAARIAQEFEKWDESMGEKKFYENLDEKYYEEPLEELEQEDSGLIPQ